jgi:hypothetical protein
VIIHMKMEKINKCQDDGASDMVERAILSLNLKKNTCIINYIFLPVCIGSNLPLCLWKDC